MPGDAKGGYRSNWLWVAICGDGGLERENREMLEQFYRNLEVDFATCPKPGDGPDAPVYAMAEKRLSDGDKAQKSWSAAYQVEQLIARLRPKEDLRAEVIKRLGEAKRLGNDSHADYLAEFDEACKDAADADRSRLRALLARLLDDNQWRYSQLHHIRRLNVNYCGRLMVAFAAVAFLFVATLIVESVSFQRWDSWRFSGYLLAAMAGLLGASFSMLIRQREASSARSIEAMRVATGWPMVYLRLGTGGGAAAILYFIFQTGLVDGVAFPTLEGLGFTKVVGDGASDSLAFGLWAPNAQLSLLVVWSVLAGFSEQLVPSMLSRVEERAEAKPKA